MSDFNPFEHPPTTPRVELSGTPDRVVGRPTSRLKLAGGAVAGAALMGGAIFGVSMFASADQPQVLYDAPTVAAERIEPVSAETADDPGDPIDDEPDFGAVLGDLGACLGMGDLFAELGDLGGEMHRRFDPQAGSEIDGDIDWAPGDTNVTVTGPDGIDIYTIGEGDGSITVTRSGDDVVVATDGDVAESEVFDFEDFNLDDFNLDDLDLSEFNLEDFDLGEFNLEDFDLGEFDLEGTPLAGLGECLSDLDLPGLEDFEIGNFDGSDG